MVKHLVVGSGAMIAFKIMGVLKYLKDFGHLAELKEISAASSGALISAVFILYKGDVERLFDFVVNVDIKQYTKIDIKNFIKKYGLINTNGLEQLIFTSGLRDVTFRELYEIYPVKLHIATYDILSKKTIYCSIDTTPDLDVSNALLRSIAVPLLFTPVDGRYIDGSAAEFSPCSPFLGFNDVFEIRAENSLEILTPPKSLIDYLKILISTLISNRERFDDFKRISVPIDYDIFNFGMSSEERCDCYISGYQLSALQIPHLIAPPKTDHLTHCTDAPSE
jgi:predicted acylesterase/phospholipase RssA